MYDGAHTYKDHYKSLVNFYEIFDDEFIFIVDDWNWIQVRDGTYDAIEKLKLNIKFFYENREINYTWHNGIGVFILSKK